MTEPASRDAERIVFAQNMLDGLLSRLEAASSVLPGNAPLAKEIADLKRVINALGHIEGAGTPDAPEA